MSNDDMNRRLRAGREPAEPAKAATGAMNQALRAAAGRAPAPTPAEGQAPEPPSGGFEGGAREPGPVELSMSDEIRRAASAIRGRRGVEDLYG